MWEFPGGKVRNGETHADAIRRELWEELCVETIKIGEQLCSVKDPGSHFVIIFIPVQIKDNPILMEHDEFSWRPVTDMLEINLAPSDARFVRECLSKG